jgi:hypothetical protein
LALVAFGCVPHVALAAWPCWCPFGSCGASGGGASVVPVANQTTYKSPTVIAKMGYGTKKLMTNTKNLLTFNKSGNQNTMTAGYSTRTKHKEPGFFYKLFHPEPPPPPQTVKEWMSLEQIHP